MKIELQNVSFSYGSIPVLKDINLILDKPGLVCILGPNGVGKSTLVKCMNKLLRPTSGQVLIDGEDISGMSQKDVSLKIGYVPVRTEDTFSMTVLETVLIGRHNKQKWHTSSQDVVKAMRALKALGIDEFANRSFRELSAGQHQSVAIARGLVQETEVLILDEPTSNLDLKHQMYVTELLREIAKRNEILVLMISHNLNIASMYADNIILMAEPGVIRQVGTVDEVITRDNIKAVYGVDCDVVVHEGRPAMLINRSLQ